jgi:drug/metabolite transporter (DMT)-like permease
MIASILLILLYAIVNASGIFLQKLGLEKVRIWKDTLRSSKWIVGTLLFAPAYFLYVLALKYEKLSIVQTAGNFSILFLVILEFVFLKERIKKHEVFALALFFLGIILIGL